ncbi:MAG: IS30 family transposase [Candidatus Kaiserbacteria bacterium]|nr:IS30 family transposase [Candidatus Kaiserbacteria bacterium]
MQQTKYRRLSDNEREEISRGLAINESQASIAHRLHRDSSTISREIHRNSGKSGYRAFSSGQRAMRASSSRRYGKRRLFQEPQIQEYILFGLRKCWSPREIVRRIQIEYPQDMSMRISHEAIYQYVYVLPRGSLKKELISCLRQERKHRRKKGGRKGKPEETRGKIADMLSIEERPKEVEDRIIPGHWEGDLIMGKYKRTALGTLVERTTRYTLLVPLGRNKSAIDVRKAYAKAMKTIPKELTKTLTYDQGKEMSEHKRFTIDTGIQVYFAHPGSPWERGTNENTNGLIRQYFPKGTEFDKVPTREIKRVQRQLNDRPRAALDFYKPDEKFNELVALER